MYSPTKQHRTIECGHQLSTAMTVTIPQISPLLTTNISPQKLKSQQNLTKGSLKSCKNLNEIKQLHAQITKQGLNYSSLTNLISLCSEVATKESLIYAQKMFDENANIKKPSLYMINSLLRGYSIAGLGIEAIALYSKIRKKGVKPDHYTYPFVLSACTKVAGFNEGVQLHASIIKLGFDRDMFIENTLIHFYNESGNINCGKKIFDEMSEKNVVSWTSLICGYARGNRPKEAVYLFFEMLKENFEPNSVTLVCVISACAKLGDLELGERVFSYIEESGLEVNAFLVNSLAEMYLKCGATDKAKRLFDECGAKDLVLYNIVLSNCVKEGVERECFVILEEMLRHGPRPDGVTMLSAVSLSGKLGDILFGRRCHGYILRNGLEDWDGVSNILIDMYLKCGKPDLAVKVFDNMLNKTVVSWNSLLSGFVRNRDMESARQIFENIPEPNLVSWNIMINFLVGESLFGEAIEMFRVMQSKGVKADEFTMVCVASACGYIGSLNLAKWTYKYIQDNGIYCDMRLNTALVDMFARCGDSRNAMQVFGKMRERDVSTWTAAIGAMAFEGNGTEAIQIFNEMLKHGVEPDDVVLVQLLRACSHSGLVDEGLRIFQSMKETYNIRPHIVHYGCMVDLLGRAGMLSGALDLIKTMPMDPNSVIWRALLAACRTHKNEEIATYAAEKLTSLDDNKSGAHVLLSNIYASAGKWTDVAETRLRMKEQGIQKEPGASSIEFDGMVHEFTSTDESHPKMTSISKMLNEIDFKIRIHGYGPDLENVLVDVDDREKNFLLSRHSEKMAIAFGLISSCKGAPIRVMKNLRMCSDCHTFAKLVSKVYDREIVVRDNNRFHFFQQGLCSCRDFW